MTSYVVLFVCDLLIIICFCLLVISSYFSFYLYVASYFLCWLSIARYCFVVCLYVAIYCFCLLCIAS